MASEQLSEKPSSRVQVLEAIYSLHEGEVEVTVDSLVRYTGLKTVTVNDCIKELRERDEIWSLERGVYRPKLRHEQSRAVSITPHPSGMVKLEIGDVVLDLTPREVQIVAPFFAGINTQVAASAYNHTTMAVADRLAKAERKIRAMEELRKLENAKQTELDVTPIPEVNPNQLRLEV